MSAGSARKWNRFWLTAAWRPDPAVGVRVEQVPGSAIELQRITIHGHERAFVKVGKGPALLLLHGLGCTHTTWLPVIHDLARHYTVIAPDLLGPGESAKPRADY